MREAAPHPFLVPFDGSFDLAASPSAPDDIPSKKECKRELAKLQERLKELQEVLYAQDMHSVLLVFQAMDAAGKDSTIRAVLSGVNPAGCQVHSFKQPSSTELDHDFLWRTARALPERGRIGVFNRSYYEEVLVVRVHPRYLAGQRIPSPPPLDELFAGRFDSIRDHEKHLARNGTVVVKFWLNVSWEEQRNRFLARIDEPHKNWKFAAGDVEERKLWPKYMHAYESALNETSRPWAPWYAIPADDKPYMRLKVAEIIVQTLESLKMGYPELASDEQAELSSFKDQLLDEDGPGT